MFLDLTALIAVHINWHILYSALRIAIMEAETIANPELPNVKLAADEGSIIKVGVVSPIFLGLLSVLLAPCLPSITVLVFTD